MSQDKLTRLARGMPCQVRLEGCDGGGETTVLAHFRSVSLGAGVGHKPPSWLGAWACHSCHELIDGRRQTLMHRDYYRLAHAMGVLRTIETLIADGVIRI